MMLALIIAALLLSTPIISADSQPPPFQTNLLAVFRAVSRGDARKALSYYETRAVQYEEGAKSSDSPDALLDLASRAYRQAAGAANYLGDFQKAIDYGEKALALADKLDSPRIQLPALSTLAGAYRRARNFPKMAGFIERGFRIAKNLSPNSPNWLWWHGVFHLHRGRDFRYRGEYDKAAIEFQQVIKLKKEFLEHVSGLGQRVEERKEHARVNMLLGYAALGRTYLAMGKPDRALETYKTGLAAADTWQLDFPKGTFYVGIGDCLYRQKDFAAALINYRKARDLGRRQQRPTMFSQAARGMGDVLREIGKIPQAVASYKEAIEQIESVRSLLTSQSERQSYFSGWLAAYSGVIDALWETGAQDRAFHYAERVRARTFLDMLGTRVRLSRAKNEVIEKDGTLEEVSEGEKPEKAYKSLLAEVRKRDPERASLMAVEPLTLTQVQALIEPGHVLLEYLVTPKRIMLWAIEQKRFRTFSIALSQAELAEKVQALRAAISDLDPAKDYNVLARDLYERLISPAIPMIQGKGLILVPHDVLHYLPFHALYSPQGRYLIEDFPISYLSNASVLKFIRAKRKTVGEKIIAFGNPNLGTSRAQLPLAELEARAVGSSYAKAAVFVGSDATEQRVKSLASVYNILHFATHAELNKEDPLSSAVLLAQEGKEDGRLQVREIFGMQLKADLVVLSGCETGLGKLATGDELVGLTRAFIYAGTPSVVASLWKVDDASTAALMRSFYKNLKSMSKVEALRHAQLEMIRGKQTSDLLAHRGVGGIGRVGEVPQEQPRSQDSVPILTSHAYFWAPFILVGSGE